MLTTSNFPDVMQAGYAQNRFTAVFSVAFMVIGIYFLMPLVLASVFNTYQKQQAAALAKNENARISALNQAFDCMRPQASGTCSFERQLE
jgi:outer membrane murein-binding lipoprotein Lpp